MIPHINETLSNAAIGRHEEILNEIHSKNINIAIYERNIERLDQELSALNAHDVECRACGAVDEITPIVTDYLSGMLKRESLVAEDIAKLLTRFASTSGVGSFRLLLTTVDSGMCRKFHTDINDLRLLCTYIGPGTLWVPDRVLDKNPNTSTDPHEEIRIDERDIQQVRTGDVAILKGALYADANPIMHKSPAVEGREDRRILLRIDTNAMYSLWS